MNRRLMFNLAMTLGAAFFFIDARGPASKGDQLMSALKSQPDTVLVTSDNITPPKVSEFISALETVKDLPMEVIPPPKEKKTFADIVLSKGAEKGTEYIQKALDKKYPDGYKFKAHNKKLNEFLAPALYTEIAYGTPYKVSLAQKLIETQKKGVCTGLAKNGNNHFAMKFTKSAYDLYDGVEGIFYWYDDCYKTEYYWVWKDGVKMQEKKKTKIKCKFIKFENSTYSFLAHSKLFFRDIYLSNFKDTYKLKYYRDWEVEDVENIWTYALAKAGYAGGPKAPLEKRMAYKSKLRSVITSTGLGSASIREDLGIDFDKEHYNPISQAKIHLQ